MFPAVSGRPVEAPIFFFLFNAGAKKNKGELAFASPSTTPRLLLWTQHVSFPARIGLKGRKDHRKKKAPVAVGFADCREEVRRSERRIFGKRRRLVIRLLLLVLFCESIEALEDKYDRI